MDKRIKRTLFAAVALLSVGATLEAAQINGTITFRGGEELNTGSVNTATRVIGWHDQNLASPKVVSRSGDFSTFVNVGDSVAMTAPWIFGSGRSGLWSVGNFTFDLTTSTIVHQGNGTLNITGTGTISGNGFDPTPGSWSFSTQNPPANGVFSFSGATAATP